MTTSSIAPKDSDKVYVEKISESSTLDSDSEFERKTMRYVDWRIVPILGFLASFNAIDRGNIGSAYVAGMADDLALAEGARFTMVICLFFVPEILLQIPANLFLRKFGVRNWLTFIGVSWGAVQLGMGFVQTWPWLVVCRVLLGACQATMYPSLLFIMTTWYKRHEVQTRLAAFLLINYIAGGLGPILAYAFSSLNGRRNLAGWRWIFIMEGFMTILMGFITCFLIPDFPDQNTFLTAEQKALVLRRLDEDRGDALPDVLTAQKVRKHLMDWKIWAFGIMFLCSVMPAYSLGYFLPIILHQMGWSRTQALLLSAAPTLAAIFSLVVAFFADKYKHRSGFIFFTVMTCIVGLVLLAFAREVSVRYFAAFLITAASSGCIPTITAYGSNNVVSHSKRSVQSGVLVMLGEVGGLMGSLVFRVQDAPRYIPGFTATIICQCVSVLILLATTVYFIRQNKLMREGKRAEPLENQPGFYYTL